MNAIRMWAACAIVALMIGACNQPAAAPVPPPAVEPIVVEPATEPEVDELPVSPFADETPVPENPSGDSRPPLASPPGHYSAAAWNALADRVDALTARLQTLEELAQSDAGVCRCGDAGGGTVGRPATAQAESGRPKAEPDPQDKPPAVGSPPSAYRSTGTCRRGPFGRWRCN